MNIDTNLQLENFSNINLEDPFFDSLKSNYQEFSNWFKRKSEEKAFVIKDEAGMIQGFVYLKEENEAITDVTPSLPSDRYLKIGTFKINAHGTKLGERFIKKAFDLAVAGKIKKLYVTVFSEHNALMNLFLRYGFKKVAEKATQNGVENVLLKEIGVVSENVENDYPMVSLQNNQYLLGIYPEFHTRLFPDSILNNEHSSIVNDVSHTNSIEKIYICKMKGLESLKRGDALVIYRTSDGQGSASYRAVATSLCMVEDVKSKNDFKTLSDFLIYCSSRSVFTKDELSSFYNTWSRMFVIKMTYNAAFKSRIIRKRLIEEVGLFEGNYWGFMPLNPSECHHVAKLGGIDDSLIFD